MIYFKRFLFGIVTLCSILFGVVGTILLLLFSPIIGFIYYMIPGNNLTEDYFKFYWNKIIEFICWCEIKLFKDDKR